MTAEALLAISERPSTSLSQVMDTPDPEVILQVNFGRWPLDYVTLWLSLFLYTILHPWNLLVPMKHQPVLVPSKSHLFPTSLQVHQFYHLRYYSHSLHFPVYRKLSQIATNTTVPPRKFTLLYVWLMAWQIRLSSVTCMHPTRGFNFSGIFFAPSGNSSTKNHEDRPRGSPPNGGVKCKR